MNNKNLLELGGSVDLIATAICDFDTPTRHYKKDYVVLDIKDVDLVLTTTEKTTRAKDDKLVLANVALTMTGVSFPLVPLEKQIYELLGSSKKLFTIIKHDYLACELNGIILPLDYIENANDLKIENVERFIIENDTESKTTVIKSDEFIEGQKYEIQYVSYELRQQISFDSYDTNIPYLSLQIKIKGNVDKKGADSYLFIEKAKLHYDPVMRFVNQGVTYCTLYFDIIDSEKKPSLVI